ncbi:hypothetical protein [Sphingobacterium composti Ten et al. 2007 non Yoo et al. 2007]|uniref:hypothetical protein n=1 Tax=Sphingobacterium composti TaxID=363260 RepID=UPI001F2B17E8|nr:hypothetical protein [Sphingobacterium composti Ten et al. 2007 non Yoo et al. 2007]
MKVIGIDIAKETFVVAYCGSIESKIAKFTNDVKGIKNLFPPSNIPNSITQCNLLGIMGHFFFTCFVTAELRPL